ncbi:MAG: hypothetical protein FD141_990 [Fusobacteria bacterium]|nr:MAG: hypothetical protein FD141_990 [Fusobacteriota bacterium]KAF0229703.1 MAG: hypothetical protein FD182_93 [Fusobacteriota bacterium]
MTEFLFALVGIFIGGIIIYFTKVKSLDSEINLLKTEIAKYQSLLESEKKLAFEKEKLLKKSEEDLTESFRTISYKLLKENQANFLDLAKSEFAKTSMENKNELEKKEESIKNIVTPMKEILGEVKGKMEEIDKEYQKTFTEVKEQFKFLKEDQTKLQIETANLVKALRAPQTRGRWGEIQLKRVVEMAGMVNCVDFVEQFSTDSDTGRLRPDMLIKLPGNKTIVIDAKTPLDAYLNLIEAVDDIDKRKYLLEHGRQVKDHIGKLSCKAYWDQFPESPEFVVLFLPNEALYGAALEAEPQLIEVGASKNVIIATPTTLIALLKAIAYGWNQETLAVNAKLISNLGKELYDRMSILAEHLDNIKKGLDRSVDSYNKAVGAFESRVLPTTRKFKELGISSDKSINELNSIEIVTKDLRSSD